MTGGLERLRALLRPHPAWGVVAAALGLCAIGIRAIGTVEPALAQRQLVWLVVGLVTAGACLLPPPRLVGRAAPPLFLVCLAALVFLLLPFAPRWLVPVRNGVTAWIDLQVLSVQPAEPAKIAFVLVMAWYLRYRRNYRTLRGLLVPFALMLLPVGLILQQPDLGTAMLFGPTLLAMLVAAGARLTHLGAIVGLGLCAAGGIVASIYVLPESAQPLEPYQRMRIKAMISQIQGEDRYVRDVGYQQHKAITLVGAGGLSGQGPRARRLIELHKLPYDYNDMIFVVIVNRWGLLGALFTLALYGLLFLSLIGVAARARDPFARLATVGFAGLLATQTGVNIGIAVGLLPVTGLTLPLVSYGGSSLVATFGMVGLAANFGVDRPGIPPRPSFEFPDEEPA